MLKALSKMNPLIVALDVHDARAALSLVRLLGDDCGIYKVGPSLYLKYGPAFIKELQKRGKKILLDLKLHDIPSSVARAVKEAGKLGVWAMTIHASGGKAMIKAAAKVKPRPELWAVTILTSLSEKHLQELGCSRKLPAQVLALARIAKSCGAEGVVCSVNEARQIRKGLGRPFTIVTPGIRLSSLENQDHERAASPSAARSSGADFMVVGRPILEAKDPARTARRLFEDWQR